MDIFGFKNELFQAMREAQVKKQLMHENYANAQKKINNTLTSKTVLGSAFVTGVATVLVHGKGGGTTVDIVEKASTINANAIDDRDLMLEIEARNRQKKTSILDGLTDELVMALASMIAVKATDYVESLFEQVENTESRTDTEGESEES